MEPATEGGCRPKSRYFREAENRALKWTFMAGFELTVNREEPILYTMFLIWEPKNPHLRKQRRPEKVPYGAFECSATLKSLRPRTRQFGFLPGLAWLSSHSWQSKGRESSRTNIFKAFSGPTAKEIRRLRTSVERLQTFEKYLSKTYIWVA